MQGQERETAGSLPFGSAQGLNDNFFQKLSKKGRGKGKYGGPFPSASSGSG